MNIKTIHLLHHTHVDYGFTDLPGTMSRLQREYTAQALDLIDANRQREDAARFRWTIEVTDVVHEFLAQASESQRKRLLDARQAGLLDVGALPFHPTGFSGEAEWMKIEARYAQTRDLLKPRVAILNDANGLPWGLVPKLLDQGVSWLSTGLNEHCGRPPRLRPAFFRWEGPDGRLILVWLGLHYCAGFFFFHETEWRRGPVPNSADVFFNPPEHGDVWNSEERNLKSAEIILAQKLRELADYPHADFGLQITNMWRMDNDPPFGGLCDFVSAWNASGRTPQLRLSTFEQFFEAATSNPTIANIETLRGDWVNWWADGIASFPRENVAIARTVRTLTDLKGIAAVCQSELTPDVAALEDAAWQGVSLFNEHTCDSYDAMANPAGFLSLGHKAKKSAGVFQAEEDARSAVASVLRAAPEFTVASRGRGVMVVNPGDAPRSGWIEIPADALRYPANGFCDEATGEVFPAIETLGPKWSEPLLRSPRPYAMPNDTFTFSPHLLRAFIPDVPARSARRLAIGQYAVSEQVSKGEQGLTWEWGERIGRIISLRDPGTLHEWVDTAADVPFGGNVCEIDRNFGARQYLSERDVQRIRMGRERSFATAAHMHRSKNFYGEVVELHLAHPLYHHAEQSWFLHRLANRLEITTSIWLRETFDPVLMALAFPFAASEPELIYTSFGNKTRVGADQLPGCCGDYALTEGEISVESAQGPQLTLRCAEMPLVAFESLHVHEGSQCFTPSNAHVFTIFELTHWMTNFAHVLPGKLVLKHVIDTPTSTVDALYAMPCSSSSPDPK